METQTIKVNVCQYNYSEDDIFDGVINYQYIGSYTESLELSEIIELLQSAKSRGVYSGSWNGWITLDDTNDGTISSIESGLIIKKDIFFADIERKAKHFFKLTKLANVQNLPEKIPYI